MTLTQLQNAPVAEAAELQPFVRQAIAENNSTLAGCNVHWLFRASRVNLKTGRNGIRWLIAEILTEASAVFTRMKEEENGEIDPLRHVYVAYGLTTEEIVSKVRATNGFDKYPDKTIADYLSTIMNKDGQVAKVRMTAEEDCNRECKVPRCKWYLLSE